MAGCECTLFRHAAKYGIIIYDREVQGYWIRAGRGKKFYIEYCPSCGAKLTPPEESSDD